MLKSVSSVSTWRKRLVGRGAFAASASEIGLQATSDVDPVECLFRIKTDFAGTSGYWRKPAVEFRTGA